MLHHIAKKIFGTRNERVLKSIAPLIQQIDQLEKTYQAMSDDQLKGQTQKFKERIEKGETLDSILPEAFAVVREGSQRVLGMRHFEKQMVGGTVLHRGMIAEMKTGEGKTLVATLPSYLNALAGKGVHVVTVNDYLARRDAEWMGRLHQFLGLSVGVVYSGMNEEAKRRAYRSDITYGQNNEFGFDYLRDNMKFSPDDMFQRGHFFAIVDEVDSILIDEARTPLIISGPAEDATDKYHKINQIIPYLQRDKHFQMDLRSKQPSLSEEGIAKVEELLSIENLYDPANIELLHHVNQGLRAHTTMQRDVDYVVKDGQIIIVDEFTGRLMPGRRWSDGLHQAIEAKESLQIAQENQTLATVTFQNYFRMYSKLAGMTGTADTEAVEFKKIYNLDVVVVPPNRVLVRKDETDRVFRTRKEKYEAVASDIVEVHKTGQPILVGTISIEQSESLSNILKHKGVPHNVLNAKAHEREAEIVAQAGRFGSVTISTNMAGRGTDILLGGNAEFLAQAQSRTRDREDPAYKSAFETARALCAEEKEKVLAAGGLFIMGTERHEARRIDNQLRGRAGRQGDPGRSRFYISLEDELMKRFGGDRIQMLMKRFGWEEGVAIDGGLISRSIETAQKRVEAMHFDNRKHVTEYDDVMSKQRQVIYGLRTRVLFNTGIQEEVLSMMDDLIEDAVLAICDEKKRATDWDLTALQERISFLFNFKYSLPGDIELSGQTVFDGVRRDIRSRYDQRVEHLNSRLVALRQMYSERVQHVESGEEGEGNPFDFDMREIEKSMLLRTLDHLWLTHLQDMDYLREGIGLRGYGQKNPLHEYQREAFQMFQQMMQQLQEVVVRQLFFYELPEPEHYLAQIEEEQRRREALESQMQMVHQSSLDETEQEGEDELALSKDPVEQRARLLSQKKARRRARK